MRLSDVEIQKALDRKDLVLTPYPPKNSIKGVSVDLTLGDRIRVFQNHWQPTLDLGESVEVLQESIEKIMSEEIELNKDNLFYLHPGELILAVTQEYVEIPNYLVGWLDGRSSLARLGLMVHVTAHRIDPGWKGQIVLECHNVGKLALRLRPGMKIGALSFETILGEVAHPYGSRKDAKYFCQKGPQFSAVADDCKE